MRKSVNAVHQKRGLPVFPVFRVLKLGLSLRNPPKMKCRTASSVKFLNTFYSLKIGVPFTQGRWWA